MTDIRRKLPSVDRLLRDPEVIALAETIPRPVVVAAVRTVLQAVRDDVEEAPTSWVEAVRRRVEEATTPTLVPVLNATGVVLHTNLGRAVLAPAALEAMQQAGASYSNLEYGLDTGQRGSRHDHCRHLLAELSGAEDALVLNNAAGALVVVLNALAEGREVILSRGELIEIGGSFRIPDILGKSGAILREVGTTNRTHLDDYRQALSKNTGAILTVHRSNFELKGFVTCPDPKELALLAREHQVPYLHDIGSGLLADLSPWGLVGEPRVTSAVASGADAVIFSGDKLLGGPQAGCLVGTADIVAKCRANPLARAFRTDKATLAGLGSTLAMYRDPDRALRRIPTLQMLTVSLEELGRRARDLAALCPEALTPSLMEGSSTVGGGAFPGAPLPTMLVALDPGPLGADRLARRLRLGRPALVARIADGKVLLDPRTLPPDAVNQVIGALTKALTA